eukprot:gene843-9092_t
MEKKKKSKKQQDIESEYYVMLVKSENKKHVWQEFSLPLSLQLLEKWTNLENFWFQEVLSELGPDFHTKETYLVDQEKISFTNLENEKIYFVFGNEIEKLKSSNKTQNPFITDGIIRNFRKITGSSEQVAIGFLESFSSQSSLDYKKSIMAYFESKGTPARDLNQLAIYSISKGEVHIARELLEQKIISIDTRDPSSGIHLLHLACNSESFKFIKFLLENGSKKYINAVDNDGWTPLFFASIIGNPLIIKLLIDNGADINRIDLAKRTPLHMMAKSGKSDAILFLLSQKGLNVNPQTTFGYTPLFLGVKSSEVVKALLTSNDIDIDLPDHKGHTPLQFAIQKNEIDSIKYLVNAGANLNSKDSNGFTPLHFAISTKKEDIALLLIKLGADIKAKDNDGQTPLHISLSSNFPDLFRELVELGENPNIYDPYFKNYPIQYAAGSGLHLLLDVFIESNSDLNIETESFPWERNQSTPLMNAIANGHTDFVKKLLQVGKCDVNRHEKLFQQTPLHLAVESNDIEIVKILISNGSKVNLKDCFGRTPLIIAKQKKQKKIHDLLLKNGSIESIEDIVGNNGYYNSKPMSKLDFIDFHEIQFGIYEGEKLDIFLTKSEGFLVMTDFKNEEHLCRKVKFHSTKEAIDTYCEIHYLSTLPYCLKSISSQYNFKPIQPPSLVCFRYGSIFDLSLKDTPKNVGMVLKEDQSVQKALEATEKLCLYLAALHQQKFIHKNLSLEAYYENSKVGVFVLGDLGTPCIIRSNKDSEFNAPELKNSNFEGHTIETDIYALGTTIFESFCKEKYDRKRYPTIDDMDHEQLQPIISKYILPIVFDCLNLNPFIRPTVEEVRNAIHEARRVFTFNLCRQRAQMVKQYTGQDPDEATEKGYRFEIYKSKRIGSILTKILLKECYCDEKKTITFDAIKYFQDNLDTVLKRIKDAYPKLKDEKSLKILGKYVSTVERNDDLISIEILKLFEDLIENLPEKEVFIVFDMLRVLLLSSKLSSFIVHSKNNLLHLFEEKYVKKFNTLTINPTKLMIFRVLCNMFNDCELINYWCQDLKRFSLIISLVISGIKDQNKNVRVTAISFCSNLTLNGLILNPIESIQWFKLIDFLLEFMKANDSLDKDSSSKLAISFYRLIKENTNKQQIQYVQEMSDIIYYWNIDDNLKTSIIESLIIEGENDETSDKFEIDYGLDE